ncbi:MAG: hypothetical protein L0I26_10030 [Lactococcus lactis]|nr:hypothetical protein [Lactococcus lactis]
MVAPGATTRGDGNASERDNTETSNCSEAQKDDDMSVVVSKPKGLDKITLFNKMGITIPIFRNSTKDQNGKVKEFSVVQHEAKNWLHKAESFCKFLDIAEEQRVWLVSNRLEDAAYDWFVELESKPSFDPTDWNSFKQKFSEAFCPISNETQYIDDFRILGLKLKPGQPVAEYVAEFNNLRKLLTYKEGSRMCVSRFLFGLTEDLREYVMAFKPTTIESAIKLAQEGEESKKFSSSGVGRNSDNHIYRFNSRPRPVNTETYARRGVKRFKRSKPSKKLCKPVDNSKNTSTYLSSPPSPVTDPVEVNSFQFDDQNEPVVGYILKMDLTPQQVKPRLCNALVNGTYQRSLLIDTGSTTDVVSYDTVNQLGCVDKIVRYSGVKRAAIIKDFVNVIGYIPLEIALTFKGKEIKEIRSFYVLDTDQDLFILGLPFVKKYAHLISLSDLVEADLDNFKNFNSDRIQVNVFDYNGRYVNKIVKKAENESFLGYIYSLSTDDDDREETIDVELKTPQVNRMRKMIMEDYADVITEESPSNLPPIRRHQHRIVLIDPKKVSGRNQYPLSFSEKQELTKQVDKLLQQGFIRESSSPYNSPVLFVRKKDKSLRMCVDYRLLNNNTIKDKFPLPRIEQLISRFGQAKVYSKLDLMSGYYQVRIAEEDIEKTAFSTDYGHYEWVVMPFGLTNAPATFQRMMNTVLKDYLNKFVQVYLDDIFIYSTSFDEHYQHLRTVLNTLRRNKLIAKKSKCAFFFEELRFLGHVITPSGIRTDPEKIDKVKNWPTPKTIKDAQMFLGLTSYYRRFIKNHSKIANPIHKFIAKESPWTESQDVAFEKLKDALIHSPTLVHPDWSECCVFVVHTDACGTSLGYTLEQLDAEGKLRGVIAYGSKKLVGSQLNYGIYDREFLAVVEALRTWRYYLLGRRFIIRTDHQSLIYLKNQNLIDSARVARWLDYLAQYDFEIQYI